MAIWKKKTQASDNYQNVAGENQGRKGKKKNKKARVIIIVIVIALIVIRVVSCAAASNAGALVTTAKAERGDLQESISTSGTVAGEEEKVIFSHVNARVENVSVAAGDAVKEGTVLISFDMEEMEKTFRQATLQYDKSSAAYQSAVSDSADGSGELAEANARLDLLEQQIADDKAHLKDLQKTMEDCRRHTGNALAEIGYNLRQELSDLEEQRTNIISGSGDVSGNNIVSPEQQAKLTEIEEKIKDINKQISHNSYLQSVYSSSDYLAELQQEIEDVQEHLTQCETEKAKMESKKATGESKTMDIYDRKRSSADKELAEMSYEEAQKEYEAAQIGIRAEFDGIITECNAVAGAMVTNGMQLLTIESSDRVKVSFNASKYDIEKLQTGQKADVTISGNVYEGEISKINRMAATGNSTTPMVGVEVHLLNPDDKIILGMDAKLTIYTKKAQDALLIPVEAVNSDRNGDFLYIVEGGKVVKRTIVCGISTDTYAEVIEGITEEDEIIITSFTALEEGMSVTVMPQ